MRQPLHLRLRPFVRRDLRARLVSALVAVVVVCGLSWLGIAALTKVDSAEGHALRTELGLEHPHAVCGGDQAPGCNYDDRRQIRVDRKFAEEQAIRVAVLRELAARATMATAELDDAEDLLRSMKTNPRTGALEGDTVALRDALEGAIVDLSPIPMANPPERRRALLGAFDDSRIRVRRATDAAFLRDAAVALTDGDSIARAIRVERRSLDAIRKRIAEQRARDTIVGDLDDATANRIDLVSELTPNGTETPAVFARRLETAGWLTVRANYGAGDNPIRDRNEALVTNTAAAIVSEAMPAVDRPLAQLARFDLEALHTAVTDPGAPVWREAWADTTQSTRPIVKDVIRYRSPIQADTRWRLLGAAAFLFASIMLIVVGPIVTATTTAREREAGTLPVLRMTGLSAGDLALAMAVGPNVFALVAGGVLLALAVLILSVTAGIGAVLLPLAMLLVLSEATHLTAIGLGDALGQRVNAMVVGGLLALGILGPGLVGAVMVVGDLAATGLLLGPLPAMAGSTVGLSGLGLGTATMAGDFGGTLLGYAIVIQALLGGLCLLSWRRRVEQAWAPLFRPIEGAALALASVGCSALAVLDLSARLNVQTYDTVNLVTAVATAFLMPVLGWLLVSSLVRPSRASALASVDEARRAFWRFQAFIVLTGLALAGAYTMVLHETGLASEKSEAMWATLAQGLLVAETAAATLLWASRRPTGKHRVIILGSALAIVQLVFAIAVYNVEVQHVALTQASGLPFMVGMETSPYWVAFMVVLWAAGLGMILAALLRERGKSDDASAPDDDADADENPRYLH